MPESLYMQSVKHLIDTGAYFVRRHTPILQGECDFVLHLVGDEQIHRVLGHIPTLAEILETLVLFTFMPATLMKPVSVPSRI